jgi:hypothetical protein
MPSTAGSCSPVFHDVEKFRRHNVRPLKQAGSRSFRQTGQGSGSWDINFASPTRRDDSAWASMGQMIPLYFIDIGEYSEPKLGIQ